MHVGEEYTTKRKLSNWGKIQNTQHHKNKSMAAESVPSYYCQQVSSTYLLVPPPLILLPCNSSHDIHPCCLLVASFTS